mgnify:CR=1 FL=1
MELIFLFVFVFDSKIPISILFSSRIYSADANNIGLNLEMDAILAVALGGNHYNCLSNSNYQKSGI